METIDQVPAEIIKLIEDKKAAIKKEIEEKKAADLQEKNMMIELGRRNIRARISDVLKTIPEWLRPYDVTESKMDEDAFERCGKGPGYFNLERMDFSFVVPGLASIEYDPEKGNWRNAHSYTEWVGNYDHEEPIISFTSTCYWRSDLEYTLLKAREEFVNYQSLVEECQASIERDKKIQEEQRPLEEKTEAVDVERKSDIELEEKALFDALKSDPVIIHMLKAFYFVRQEREMFYSQLQDANETMYSIEERWSHRAEELRRQADDADRRAAEERSRVSDLEDDLSQANKKIKQSERGW